MKPFPMPTPLPTVADLGPWAPLLPAAVVILALVATVLLVRRSRRARGEPPPAGSVPASETPGAQRDR